jgi:hypothetical protein
MPTNRTLSSEADNKKQGMRLDELAALVQDAMRAGASGSELVEVTTVGWTSPRIKSATVKIVSTRDAS